MKPAKDIKVDELAKWMMVGYGKCWSIAEVFLAAGHPLTKDDFQLHEIAKFIPDYSRHTDPVRAIFETQYPKLASALDKGLKTEAAVSAAVGFLSKQVAKDRAQRTTREERNVFSSTSRAYRGTVAARRGKYERNNIGVTGWKVCK